LKFRKVFLFPIAIVLIFITLWAYFVWYPEFAVDQRIGELKNAGITVEDIVYDVFYLDVTSSYPQTVFAEKQSWSDFKQDVINAMDAYGSATVFVDRGAGKFVFSSNETVYYYYQVI